MPSALGAGRWPIGNMSLPGAQRRWCHWRSLLKTRDASLQLESEGDIDITQSTFRVIRHDQHPMGRWCDLVAPNAVRTQTSRITIPRPMPKYGRDTKVILERIGYDAAAIDAMLDSGAAGLSWSEKYLPE